MFNMNNAVLENIDLLGLETDFVDGGLQSSKVDLHLVMRDNGHIIEGHFTYAPTLFSGFAIHNLVERFGTLTEWISENSTQQFRTMWWGPDNQELVDAFTEELAT
jgi:hypothetical protein